MSRCTGRRLNGDGGQDIKQSEPNETLSWELKAKREARELRADQLRDIESPKPLRLPHSERPRRRLKLSDRVRSAR